MNVYPGLHGFGTGTTGGRGGQIVYVDSLEDDPISPQPGTLRHALTRVDVPRIVLSRVGGIVDLQKPLYMNPGDADVTVFGQTAPWPGLIVQGTIRMRCHDVVLQHITVACDKPTWDEQLCLDVIGPSARVVVDHCTFLYSGQSMVQFIVGEWRNPAPAADQWIYDCTVSNCIIARPGRPIDPNQRGHRGAIGQEWVYGLGFLRNLFLDCDWRSPCMQGDAQRIAALNNLTANPGEWAVHTYDTHNVGPAWLTVAGNVIRPGPNTVSNGDRIWFGRMAANSRVYCADNKAPRLPYVDNVMSYLVDEPPIWPEGYELLATDMLEDHLVRNAGARPWDREPVAAELVGRMRTGRYYGHVDHPFWLPEMPETRHSLDVPENPNEIMADGYTRLERWIWSEFEPPAPAPAIDKMGIQSQLINIRTAVDEIHARLG